MRSSSSESRPHGSRPRVDAPAPLLVDRREAARLLGVSVRTIWSMTAGGELPAVRVRGRVLYAVDDLRAFVDRQREGGGV